MSHFLVIIGIARNNAFAPSYALRCRHIVHRWRQPRLLCTLLLERLARCLGCRQPGTAAPALGPVFGTVAVACGRELFQAVMGLAPFLPCFRNLSVLLTIRLIVLSIDSVLTARWSIATVFDSFGSESYRVYSF